MSDSTLVVWDDVFTSYDFGPSHPLRPLRLELTMALAGQLGVLDRPGVAVRAPHEASDDLLELVHDPAYVAAVKACAAGQSAGYGRRFVAERDTVLATVPIGYGDGWRRGLTDLGEAVVAGARYPLVGTISMDNITVDLGPATTVRPGCEVTLIGDGITAEEVARRLGTINYEVTCGLSPRVTRTVAE